MRRLSVILLITSVAFSAIQSNMYYRGDMNSFGSTALTFRDLGTDSWMVTILSDGDDADSQFKFDNETGWVAVDWSRGASITKDSYTTWYSPNGGNGTFSESNAKYYSYIIKDVASSTNSQGFIFETSGSPITISSVSDNSSGGAVNTNISVSITLSGSKSTEEKVYVRYTTDSWSTDNWSLATGSGTSYSATISTSGSGTVLYYVLTTTLTSTGSGDLDNYPDLATLYWDSNSGSNYSYSYDQSLPVTLTSFDGSNKKGAVELSWVTESEIDNLGFLIERAVDGGAMEEIANFKFDEALRGQGSTTARTEYVWADKQVVPGIVYEYVLADVDINQKVVRHTDNKVRIKAELNNEQVGIAAGFKLANVAPNPFNPSTEIHFALNDDLANSPYSIAILDITGREVQKLSGLATSGINVAQWNGQLNTGNLATSGIYFARINVKNVSQVVKMTLMR